MILGNVPSHNGKALVAFLDILGFSSEILTGWDDDPSPLEKILSLKKGIPTLNADDIANMEANHDKKHRVYPCRVQTISDSIIISFGFENNPLPQDLTFGSAAFLYTVSTVWQKAIFNGYSLRGAIDFGNVFWNSTEIIGPAIINAIRAETAQAKTSRIVLTSDANKFLSFLNTPKGTTLHDEEVLKYLKKDIDGQIIVNPHNLYKIPSEWPQNRKKIIDFLSEMQGKAAGTTKEKYSPLISMLTSEEKSFKKQDLGKY